MNHDLSFTSEEGVRAVEETVNTASSSEQQMNDIINRISQDFGTNGGSVGGWMGEMMNNAFDNDIRPIFDELNRELSAIVDSTKSTNADLQTLKEDTVDYYNHN